MLLRLRNQGAVIDDGAIGDGIRTIVYWNGRRDEVTVRVVVASADFRELAGSAADRILMAIRAGSGVKDRPESGAGVVILLEPGLVERIDVTWRLCDTVTDA
jgi:hypothetical protein